ncbi:unnamed protein product [Sphagnum compactum]
MFYGPCLMVYRSVTLVHRQRLAAQSPTSYTCAALQSFGCWNKLQPMSTAYLRIVVCMSFQCTLPSQNQLQRNVLIDMYEAFMFWVKDDMEVDL